MNVISPWQNWCCLTSFDSKFLKILCRHWVMNAAIYAVSFHTEETYDLCTWVIFRTRPNWSRKRWIRSTARRGIPWSARRSDSKYRTSARICCTCSLVAIWVSVYGSAADTRPLVVSVEGVWWRELWVSVWSGRELVCIGRCVPRPEVLTHAVTCAVVWRSRFLPRSVEEQSVSATFCGGSDMLLNDWFVTTFGQCFLINPTISAKNLHEAASLFVTAKEV